MKLRLFILILFVAAASAQSNVNIIARSELIGRTQFVHWQTVRAKFAEKIVTVNVTNEPAPPRRLFLEWDGWAWAPESIDLQHWTWQLRPFTGRFEIAATGPRKFYRTPVLEPWLTNGVIR